VLALGKSVSRIPRAATAMANGCIGARGYRIANKREREAHRDRIYLARKLSQAIRQILRRGGAYFLPEAILDISRFIYCSINGCMGNADLELLFGPSKAAWEGDAAIIDTGEKRSEDSCYGFSG
jgi:hypothetical protein